MMTAAEVKQKSDRTAVELKAKGEAEEQQKLIAEAEEKKKRHAAFEADLVKRVENSIKWDSDRGRNSTYVELFTTDDWYKAKSEWVLQNYEFSEETSRVVKQLQDRGFIVVLSDKTNSYTTQHESSIPDYDYYDYSATLNISW